MFVSSNSFMLGEISFINKYQNQKFNKLKNKLVLFIDDDYVNYLYFKELLTNTTEYISRATSLVQALQMLADNNNFCLIILSASLPENVNNFAIRYLKAKYSDIPVISLIDCHYRYLEEEILKAGSDICISRHTDKDHFVEVFFEVLQNSEYAK